MNGTASPCVDRGAPCRRDALVEAATDNRGWLRAMPATAAAI